MDLEILREGGVAPIRPRRAYVDDFAVLARSLDLDFPPEYVASVS
jgi:hypothetical protein